MSLQVCHCGWSKVTTYHGLRTHQGMMGCTQKGVKVEESEQQYLWDLKLDDYTYIKPETTDYYSDMSLQVCHCGWSKMTTYHGLRTHQGMMGCTLKGVKVEEREQQYRKSQWEEVNQKRYQPAKTVKKEKAALPPSPPSINVRAKSAATAATIKEEYKSYPATSQHCFQTAGNSKSRRQLRGFSTSVQTADSGVMADNWRIKSRIDYATTAATIKEEPKSPLAIQRRSSHRASKSGHQPHDLSTGVQLRKAGLHDFGHLSIKSQSQWEEVNQKRYQPAKTVKKEKAALPPSPPSINVRAKSAATAATIKEEYKSYPATSQHCFQTATNSKSRRQLRGFSTSVQTADSRVMADNWSIKSRIDYATTAATIKEEPKSPLAIQRRSSHRASKSGHQPHDLSTGVQVNSLVRERPTILPRVSVAEPKQKDRKDQTLSQVVRERPTTTHPATVVRRRENHQEGQTLPQGRRKKVRFDLQEKIQLREEKMSEIIQMERTCESVPASTSTNTQTYSAAAQTTTKEDPKSLCETTQPDFSTGVKDIQETAVRPKEKPRVKQKPSQAKLVALKLSATTAEDTAVHPKETDKENQNPSQNVPDSTSAANQMNPASAEDTTEEAQLPDFSTSLKSVPASTSTNTQTYSAAAQTTTKEDPKSLCETTQPDFSTGVKDIQETAVRPKEKPRVKQKPSQAKLVALKLSATTAEDTAVHPKETDKENQNPSQNVPDSTSAANQMNPASAEDTTEEAQLPDFSTSLKSVPASTSTNTQTYSAAAQTTTKEDPKSLCETTQPDFSTGVKDIQETAVRPKEKPRVKQKPSQAKLVALKLSATTAEDTAVHPKETDKENQNPSQNVPDSTSAANQMNPASAEDTTEEAQLPDFSTSLKVKDLARMFSATTTQETAVRPKEKPRGERNPSQAKPVAQKPSATTAKDTAVHPKQKDKKNQNPSQNVPDSTRATTQMNPASAEDTTEEAQLPDFSSSLKVKDLARMFSATTTQETAVRPKEKPRGERNPSQAKPVAQKPSATTAKDTAVHLKKKHKEDQNTSQNVPDSTSAANQMNPASAEDTTEEAQLPDFSTSLKVKDLARMFSAASTQGTAVRPRGKQRGKQRLSQNLNGFPGFKWM